MANEGIIMSGHDGKNLIHQDMEISSFQACACAAVGTVCAVHLSFIKVMLRAWQSTLLTETCPSKK